MAKIVVSLVSDERVPNAFCIKNNNDADKLLFVTSMEKESIVNDLISAVGNNKPYNIIFVDAYNIDSTHNELKKYNFSQYDQIYANITCGTKPMSIGAYKFFTEIGANIFYLSHNTSAFDQLNPSRDRVLYNEYLTIHEYLLSYGVKYTVEDREFRSFEDNVTFHKNFYENKVAIKYIQRLKDTSSLKNMKSMDIISFSSQNIKSVYNKIDVINSTKKPSFDEIVSVIRLLGFDPDSFSRADLRYLTGLWLEEYVYQSLEKHLKSCYILPSFKIGTDRNNEIDVAFVHKNTLHMIECKSSLTSSQGPIISKSIDKIEAISKVLGLKIKQYLFYSGDREELQLSQLKRFNNVKLVCKDELFDLDSWIKKICQQSI